MNAFRSPQSSFSSSSLTTANVTTERCLFTSQLANALQQPFPQKCYSLSSCIQDGIANNSKDLQTFFTNLIENIFGFNSHAYDCNWNLLAINKLTDQTTFNLVYNFLHPDGVVFALIKFLMSDPLLKYYFPVACLPLPSKDMILEKRIIPEFYAQRLTADSAHVILNPFEYFLVHFAYSITNQTLNSYNFDTNNLPSNFVYIALLELYLSKFLPLNNNNGSGSSSLITDTGAGNSLWQSLSTTTSSFLHLGGGTTSPQRPPLTQLQNQSNSPNAAAANHLPKTTLLNLKPFLSALPSTPQQQQQQLLLRSPLHHQQQQQLKYSSVDTLISPAWRAETVIRVFAEMFLNIAIINKHHRSTHHHHQQQLHAQQQQQANRADDKSHLQIYSLPSTGHVRCVRVLVKHFHYFANSCITAATTPSTTIAGEQYYNLALEQTELDLIKRSIWSEKYKVQKKLYLFLRSCFEHWPLDGSFRLPLETWLSYIQPWRYVSSANVTATTNVAATMNADDQQQHLDDDSWCSSSSMAGAAQFKQFINENLLFYTIIFKKILPRFAQMDLTSMKNSLMLSRLAKVFCQQKLFSIINECEENFLSTFNNSRTAVTAHNAGSALGNWSPLSVSASVIGGDGGKHSLLSPSIRNPIASNSMCAFARYNELASECEADDFVYVSLSSRKIRTLVERLLSEIERSRAEIVDYFRLNEQSRSANGNKLSLVARIFSTVFSETQTDNDERLLLNERKKSDAYLSTAYARLTQAFKIENFSSRQAQTSEIDGNTTFDSINRLDESGIADSSSVINGSLAATSGFDFTKIGQLNREILEYQGNPDTQPVRSYEISWLVAFFVLIAGFINRKYSPIFDRLYTGQGIHASLARQVLCAPQSYVKFSKDESGASSKKVIEQLPARISLRFLASKKTLIYLLMFYLLSLLFRIQFTSMLIYFLTIFLAYIIVKAVSELSSS